MLPLASVFSLTAALLIGGAIALYKGAEKVVESMKQGSLDAALEPLIYALAWAAAGYALLEFHDVLPFGCSEQVFVPEFTKDFIKDWTQSVSY